MSGAYYNEIDPYAAQWLRNLIAAGHIAPGDVDTRSILEVKPDDLKAYTQCHFFAGIGGWSYALRLAGVDDSRPVWTGSCPCQPFSTAGLQRGSADERHLWPAFFCLISECRPGRVFGEQVAGASGLAWLDHVCADLEGAGYAAAAANLCAAGAGAPHIRQRLYWVAHAHGEQHKFGDGGSRAEGVGAARARGDKPGRSGAPGIVAHAQAIGQRQGGQDAPRRDEGTRAERAGSGSADTGGERLADAEQRAAERHGHALAGTARGSEGEKDQRQRVWNDAGHGGDIGILGHANDARLEGRSDDAGKHSGQFPFGAASAGSVEHAAGRIRKATLQQYGNGGAADRVGETIQYRGRSALDQWADLEWLHCSDGKARPTQPGLFPLAHGIPNRVGRLRAYGNAIVPAVAAAFVRAAA